VPTEAEEAVRDLVRARAALLADRKRAQQRITAMLMRHGRIWLASSWTQAHERWIAGQRFDEPAHWPRRSRITARRWIPRLAELDAVEAELAPWAGREPLGPLVARLGYYRGIAELTGLTLAAVVDWRRFPSARAFVWAEMTS
jgi:transposase